MARLGAAPVDHETLARRYEAAIAALLEILKQHGDRHVERLGKRLEREVVVTTSTDAALIGGVLIKAGDLVIDGSVRGRLNKLAEALAN